MAESLYHHLHASSHYVCTAGQKYKDDPTILAWNLINEPRCETWVPANSFCPQAVAGWFKVGSTEGVTCLAEIGAQWPRGSKASVRLMGWQVHHLHN